MINPKSIKEILDVDQECIETVLYTIKYLNEAGRVYRSSFEHYDYNLSKEEILKLIKNGEVKIINKKV